MSSAEWIAVVVLVAVIVGLCLWDGRKGGMSAAYAVGGPMLVAEPDPRDAEIRRLRGELDAANHHVTILRTQLAKYGPPQPPAPKSRDFA